MGFLYQIIPAPIESLRGTAVAFAVRSDEADLPTPPTGHKPPPSQRDRDWNNGLLLIAGIVGLPVLVAALVTALWG